MFENSGKFYIILKKETERKNGRAQLEGCVANVFWI